MFTLCSPYIHPFHIAFSAYRFLFFYHFSCIYQKKIVPLRSIMVLNYIWIALILLAVIMGCVQFFVFGQSEIFTEILNSTFASAKNGFEISIGLTGI